jgi:hypothetical protein
MDIIDRAGGQKVEREFGRLQIFSNSQQRIPGLEPNPSACETQWPDPCVIAAEPLGPLTSVG